MTKLIKKIEKRIITKSTMVIHGDYGYATVTYYYVLGIKVLTEVLTYNYEIYEFDNEYQA